MKKITIIGCLLLALGRGDPTFASSGSRPPVNALVSDAQSTQSGTNALSATVTILSQTYCHVDDESFSVLMDVRLHLTNTSNGAVILSRRIDSPNIVRVAKSMEAGEAGQFESALNPDRFVSENPPNPPSGDAPSAEYFVVLAPGQSYDVRASTAIPGTKEPTSRHGLVTRGEHVLQLGISTWPYFGYDDVQGLRKKWARFGELQLGVVYTNFAPFRIPEKFKNPRCAIPRVQR